MLYEILQTAEGPIYWRLKDVWVGRQNAMDVSHAGVRTGRPCICAVVGPNPVANRGRAHKQGFGKDARPGITLISKVSLRALLAQQRIPEAQAHGL